MRVRLRVSMTGYIPVPDPILFSSAKFELQTLLMMLTKTLIPTATATRTVTLTLIPTPIPTYPCP